MYTMKSHSLNSITCDDNGAHIQKRTAKTNYFIPGNQTQQRLKLKLYPKKVGVNISIKNEMADIIPMFIQPLVI